MSREVLLRLAGSLFKFGVVVCIFTATFAVVFGSPDTVKQAARDSKLYEGIASQVRTNLTNVNASPGVKAALGGAAASTITGEYVQSATEQTIDGTYQWLDGSADKPTFKVDARGVVDSFLQKAGDEAVAYAQKLPACPPNQQGAAASMIAAGNVSAVQCLPAGTNPALIRETAIQQLRNSNGFLQNPTLTADSLSSITKSQPAHQQAPQLPVIFQWLQWLPWLAGLLALLGAVWTFTIYRDGGKSVRRLSKSLLWISVPIAIITGIGHIAFRAMTANGGTITKSLDDTFQQYAVAFARDIEDSFARTLLIITGSLAVAGLIGIIATRNDGHVDTKGTDYDPTPPSKRRAEQAANGGPATDESLKKGLLQTSASRTAGSAAEPTSAPTTTAASSRAMNEVERQAGAPTPESQPVAEQPQPAAQTTPTTTSIDGMLDRPTDSPVNNPAEDPNETPPSAPTISRHNSRIS